MKKGIVLIVIILAFMAGFAVKLLMPALKIHAMADAEKVDRKPDEQLIRKTEASYDSAWQQGDIEGIMDCFTDEAILISPRGDIAIGKEQIRKLLSNFLDSDARSTKHISRITRISFVTDNVAVVDGEAFIEGSENMPDSIKHHSFTDILVRTGNAWLISQIRAY